MMRNTYHTDRYEPGPEVLKQVGGTHYDVPINSLRDVAPDLASFNVGLKVHISAALNVGNSRDEVIEAIQQMADYAGFPAALNGIALAREVFLKRGAT